MLNQCKDCGQFIPKEQLFMSRCTPCHEKEQAAFDQLKQLLRSKPGINLMQLSTQSDLPVSKIMGWIREGRIDLS